MTSDAVVHVVDDDDAARDSLAFLLQSAGHRVKTYEHAAAFLAVADALAGSAGCLITDVRMPEIDGLDLLRRLKARRFPLSAIVITGHGDVPLAVEAMKIGAVDFLEKPFDDDDLLAAVRNALARQQGDMQERAAQAGIRERLATLTMRERQVLDGLVAGKANKVIAHDHGISPRTVEIYRANAMTKMGAASLSDLVRMALIGGILNNPTGDGSSPR